MTVKCTLYDSFVTVGECMQNISYNNAQRYFAKA
ncbi:MAG: glucuronate isomerase [Erwinia billingiae]|nr:glucuronate isomerase [Erwinia billingiae]